jgi:hypothetical protein
MCLDALRAAAVELLKGVVVVTDHHDAANRHRRQPGAWIERRLEDRVEARLVAVGVEALAAGEKPEAQEEGRHRDDALDLGERR